MIGMQVKSVPVRRSGHTTHRSGAMPLALAGEGVTMRVSGVRGKDEIHRFLESLGFVENAAVTVVTEMNGNLIVRIMDARVAVSRSMAMRVMVIPE